MSRPPPRPGKHSIYVGRDAMDRLMRNRGRRVLVQHKDPFGRPYSEAITIPDTPISAARVALDLLLSLADEQREQEDATP